jgi:hypothetical protein
MHLIIDVLSGYLRGKRPPGPETTLFYGMHTAYGLGQMFVGLHPLPPGGRLLRNSTGHTGREFAVLRAKGISLYCYEHN